MSKHNATRDASILLLVCALCVLLFCFREPNDAEAPLAFTESTFQKIYVGMTEAEVRAMLGKPPGLYLTRPYALTEDHFPRVMEYAAAEETQQRIQPWINDEGSLFIWFDASGRVQGGRYLAISTGVVSYLK
jgi:hypothetical protein